MKNLKKFAALLLAGAMALLMLTACGGGGEVGERVPEAESNLFGKYATSSQASTSKKIIRACRLLLMDICRRI